MRVLTIFLLAILPCVILNAQYLECNECDFDTPTSSIKDYFLTKQFIRLQGTATTSSIAARARPANTNSQNLQALCDDVLVLDLSRVNFTPLNPDLFAGSYPIIIPGDFPSDNCLAFENTTVVFTDNFTFDDPAEIQNIEDRIDRECSFLWIHFSNSSCDGSPADELFYRWYNKRNGDACINSNLTLEPAPELSSDIPDFISNYRVSVESFAPWIDFGTLPVTAPDNFQELTFSNAYSGDARFFESNPAPFGSSVRLGHTVDFSIINSTVSINDARSYGDETSGVDWSAGYVAAQDECDWDCLKPSGDRNNIQQSSSNSLYMLSTARNKCAFPSSDIDNRVKLHFGTLQRGQRHYLQVKGLWLNKSYPAAQLSITDRLGTTVLLALTTASDDGGAFGGLVVPIYDAFKVIDLLIEIDPNTGSFLELVRQRTYEDPGSLFRLANIRYAGLACDNCDIYVSNIDEISSRQNIYRISTINAIRSSISPANDCPVSIDGSPCEGINGKCPQ